eukprot:791699-Pelagomonas_calceolata.AAC.4
MCKEAASTLPSFQGTRFHLSSALYIFDHLLVLPEYLVEFQYSLSSPHSCLAAKPQVSSEALRKAALLRQAGCSSKCIPAHLRILLPSCSIVVELAPWLLGVAEEYGNR